MMKAQFFSWLRTAAGLGLLCLFGQAAPAQTTAGVAQAVAVANYQGSYSAAVVGGALGLYLEQSGGKVSGRLDGITDSYALLGAVQPDGSVVGTASSAKGKLLFGGQKAGQQIKLLLAEPNADGSFNKEKTRLIVFSPGGVALKPVRQLPPQAPAVQSAVVPGAQAGLVSTRQCSDADSSCMAACSRVGGGISGMNQCIDSRCKPAYQKCMAGRKPNVTAADRDWANQLSGQSAQIHQQQMQTYQQQIDSTNAFSRQQEERLNKERFGN